MLNDDEEDEEEEVEEWDGEATWENEGDDAQDIKDESAAYLEFLKQEVGCASTSIDRF